MWGNLGAAIAPQLFIYIKSYHPNDPCAGWASVFLVCAVVQVIGAVAAMGIDATHPIKMEEDNYQVISFKSIDFQSLILLRKQYCFRSQGLFI